MVPFSCHLGLSKQKFQFTPSTNFSSWRKRKYGSHLLKDNNVLSFITNCGASGPSYKRKTTSFTVSSTAWPEIYALNFGKRWRRNVILLRPRVYDASDGARYVRVLPSTPEKPELWKRYEYHHYHLPIVEHNNNRNRLPREGCDGGSVLIIAAPTRMLYGYWTEIYGKTFLELPCSSRTTFGFFFHFSFPSFSLLYVFSNSLSDKGKAMQAEVYHYPNHSLPLILNYCSKNDTNKDLNINY